MGVEAYNFVSALNCILAQRLVRTICEFCGRQVQVSDEVLEQSALDPAEWRDFPFREGSGCIECGGTGFRGRTAIHELLDLNDTIRELIMEKRSDFGDSPGGAGHGNEVPARVGAGPRARRADDAGRDQQSHLHRDGTVNESTMSIVRRIFPSDIDALRPRLACEITPAGVLAARPGPVAEAGQAQDVVTHFAPLRMGVLVPGLKAPAMTDRAAVSAAIGQALEPIAERTKKGHRGCAGCRGASAAAGFRYAAREDRGRAADPALPAEEAGALRCGRRGDLLAGAAEEWRRDAGAHGGGGNAGGGARGV